MTCDLMATHEAINCRRFVSAWGRFEARNALEEIEYERNTLVQQYHFIATEFLRLANEKSDAPEWQQLATVLSSIVNKLALCAKKNDREPTLHEPSKAQTADPHVPEVSQPRNDQPTTAQASLALASSNTSAGSPKNQPTTASPLTTTVSRCSPKTRQPPSSFDLRAEDFDTMMDLSISHNEPTKISAHTLRKRLGLVDRSAQERQAQSSLMAVKNREEQESLQNDMMQLAAQLKMRTQSINSSLQQDAKVLDQVGQKAESNQVLLQREQQALQHQLASAIGFWTSLWLVLMVVLGFILMYLYIKVFGKRLV